METEFYPILQSAPTDFIPNMTPEQRKDLEALLLDMKFITAAWEVDKLRLLSQLVAINERSPLKLKAIYGTDFHIEGNDEKGLLAIADLLMLGSHFDDGERIMGYLIPRYRQSNDFISLSRALGIMFLDNLSQARWDKAIVYAQEMEDISRKANDKKSLVEALVKKSGILAMAFVYDQAVKAADEAERISREIGDNAGIAHSLMVQGMAKVYGLDFDGALFFFSGEEPIVRALGQLEMLALCLNFQGLVYTRKGDYKTAMAKLEEAANIDLQIGLIGHLWWPLVNQGLVYEAMGQLDDALLKYEEVGRLANEMNSKFALVQYLLHKGQLLNKKNQVDEAMALLRKSLGLAMEIGEVGAIAESLGELAVALAAKGDRDGAKEAFERHEKICREKGFDYDLQETIKQLRALQLEDYQH